MKVLFFISWVFLIECSMAEIPLPASVPNSDEIITEFRTQLVTKIVDLGKNYISNIRGNTLVFTNNESMKCNDLVHTPGEALASIQYSFSLKEKTLSEHVVYTGCNSQISLVEDVITEGENLIPQKFTDIIKGKISTELSDTETKKIYKISNGEGDEIFSVVAQRDKENVYTVFKILDQKFLMLNNSYNQESSRSILTFYGFEASYKRKYGRWGMRNRLDTFNESVLVKKEGNVLYFNNEGNLISPAKFVNIFNNTVMDRTIQLITQVIEYHTYYFPKTESTKTGNQAQRLIEELRLALNRLLANTDIGLVKVLMQDLINAAELGQIIDYRPQKK